MYIEKEMVKYIAADNGASFVHREGQVLVYDNQASLLRSTNGQYYVQQMAESVITIPMYMYKYYCRANIEEDTNQVDGSQTHTLKHNAVVSPKLGM